ncbi:MAG: dihydroorotase [Bdellovibrionales bacterium]|nr:dihydroorotase [Bdellovibrionales bacterium]
MQNDSLALEKKSMEIIRPDDWHVHLREGAELKSVLPWTIQCFQRAIVMPNLPVPLTSLELVQNYKKQIISNVPSTLEFSPLMTLFLTDQTHWQELELGFKTQTIVATKLYPAKATTHSDRGVSDIFKLKDCLKVLVDQQRPLLVHGEVTDLNVDIFDREKVFIEQVLKPLRRLYPQLKIVLEHITTKQAVDFVREQYPFVAATITAHHLWINRNAMFVGGIRPHSYCLPVAKREEHRLALIQAATSGEPMFFLGTDSAPHTLARKESACGCAGIFSAPGALIHYLEIFERENKLENFEKFASIHGPQFYNLPVNKNKISLLKKAWVVPGKITVDGSAGSDWILPFRSGEELTWSLA